jgi:hypothetical protein
MITSRRERRAVVSEVKPSLRVRKRIDVEAKRVEIICQVIR